MIRTAAILLVALLFGACVSGPPGRLAGAEPRAYRLPFAPGTSRLCVQAGPGPFSHKGSQRYAVDFAMPVGTPVLAARGGRVAAVKEDSNVGGAGREFAKDGNYIRIRHEDGTHGVYLHLRQHGALVEVGDVVRQGQMLGHSGDTGWSAMPHLHFQVDRDRRSIPIAFEDVKGDGVPQMLLWYEAGSR